VPTHFFKVVYDPAADEAIGFLMPNTKLKRRTIPHYIVSIRSIEELTGFDFLSTLSNKEQDRLETAKPDMWQ
jgi:endonuclease G